MPVKFTLYSRFTLVNSEQSCGQIRLVLAKIDPNTDSTAVDEPCGSFILDTI